MLCTNNVHLALLSLVLVVLGYLHQSASASKCLDKCTEYGTCYEPLGRCDCPWNRTGPACQELYKGFCLDRPEISTCTDDHPSLCLNGCLGRGTCLGGFCHCQAGFFGTDCSLSLDADGQEVLLAPPAAAAGSAAGGDFGSSIDSDMQYRPSRQGPKVYVYELPPEFHVKRDLHTIDRPPLHLAMAERLLTAGHRTIDGDEADYYYIPISGRDLKKNMLLKPALDYVMQSWPYWNRSQGHRHLIFMEGDVGACELPISVRLVAENATWMTFWGLYDLHPSWSHVFHQRVPCFVPGRDIVVPFMAMSSHDRHLVETPLRPDNPQPGRDKTFFFAGGVCGSGKKVLPPNCTFYKQQRYSGGVRQTFYELYHNRTGWRVVPGTDSYARDYSTSKFCLAAAGGGWGKRGIVSAMYGCVPVAATDFLYEVFEPEISWSRFGLRIAQKDIPKVADILESMPEDKLQEMQRKTACAAQHFHWSSNLGSIMQETGEFDAFATIMAILRMRIKYPDAAPDEYYDLDEGFRDFVNCVPAKRAKPLPSLCSMFIGPLYTRFADTCPPAKYFMRRRLGPPGGAACAGALDLSSCPHLEPEV